jgi:hypothetical protein
MCLRYYKALRLAIVDLNHETTYEYGRFEWQPFKIFEVMEFRVYDAQAYNLSKRLKHHVDS